MYNAKDVKPKPNVEDDIQRRLAEIAAEQTAASPAAGSGEQASESDATTAEKPQDFSSLGILLEQPVSAAEGGATASRAGQISLSNELIQVKKMLENHLQHLGYTEEQVKNRNTDSDFFQQKLTGHHPLVSAYKRDLAAAGLKLLSSDREFVNLLNTPQQVGKFILAIIAVDAEIERLKQSESNKRPGIFASWQEIPSSYKANESSAKYEQKLKGLEQYATFSLAEHPNQRVSAAPLRAGSHLYFYGVEALRQIWPFYFTAEEVREQLDNSLVIPRNQMAVNILRNRSKNALREELARYDNKTPEKYRLLITQALAVFKLLDCYAVGDLTKREEMLSPLLPIQNFAAIRNILTRPDNSNELNTLIGVNYKGMLNGKITETIILTINLTELPDRSAHSNLESALREALRKVDEVESAPAMRAVP